MAGAKLSPPDPGPKVTIGSGRLKKSPTIIGKSQVLSRSGSKKEREDEGIRIDHLQRMNTMNVSAWKMKRLMNVIRKGALSTLDEQIQDTSTHKDDKATQIQSENEAKQAARKIFQNVAMPGSRERRALALTLNDTKTAVNRLHRIINILISIVIIIIWLLILGIATTKFLLVISSQLLLVVFVFGNSCKNLFEAVIFVFVNHPFDVGDRCEIDGVQMVVEEMNILTTVFLRFDNQKIVYPNSLLGNKPIANYYRSPDMQEIVDFFVHIATPTEKITALKQRILSQVLSRSGSKKEREDEGIRIDHLQRMNTKNVSAWKMKRLMNVIRKGALSTLDEQIQDTSTHKDDKATQIQSENEAKQAARKIFQNVAMPGSRERRALALTLNDTKTAVNRLHRIINILISIVIIIIWLLILGIATTKFLLVISSQLLLVVFVFGNSCKNLFEAVIFVFVNHPFDVGDRCEIDGVQVNAFRERRALALTLNDTKTAVNRLHRIINILISIVIIIIWLLILGIATTKFLLVISSQLLLVVFVFGNSCKNLFEAVIFVFVNHPFDVGDRCEIDGVQMVVEEMNILTTVFLRFDNQKIVYPNSLLGNKPIANYYRSPDMQEIVDFFVHIATPTEKITALKQRILSYVDNKKDLWYPSPRIAFREMCGLNSMKITIWATHKMNHHNMGERFVRRGQLLEEIGKSCRETDIEYRLYPLNINVKSLPPAAAPIISDRMPMSWNNQQRNA
ncbi:hypothetical protein F2Q70_00042908 [Brassica cretica]|uniref:Mechanosensitive ion channel MscS domain-containing protein n=1 Tax=Brassica cretica TaxID=69181 RepID=A0A8S9KEP1_BRACR|nr:hypothetical protein F2Q70_00042908 [Brassica cretica]